MTHKARAVYNIDVNLLQHFDILIAFKGSNGPEHCFQLTYLPPYEMVHWITRRAHVIFRRSLYGTHDVDTMHLSHNLEILNLYL